MKISVMLRALEQRQGTGIYARNLMSSLLKIDKENQYLFIYQNKNELGSFGEHRNLREIVISHKNKFLWDQFWVPRLAKKKNVDIIFNTKFSVPLMTSCKTVMVFHGSEWYVHPEFYSKSDIVYNKLFLPFYCKRASAISSVSRFTANDMLKFIRLDAKKVFVIYSALDSRFKPVKYESGLPYYRDKYNLPERYILFVGNLYPGKNFLNIVKAFKCVKDEVGFPLRLVVVGDLRWKYDEVFRQIEASGLSDHIQFTGWVNQEDLPAIYSLADVFLFPSLYEGFGIPILEAMACGCPVVTSNTGACPEVAGDAAILVDPKDVGQIAAAVTNVLKEQNLRRMMTARGFKEIKRFSWEKAARKTLQVFKKVYSG